MKTKNLFIVFLLSATAFTFFNSCGKKCKNNDACNYDEKGGCIDKGKVTFWNDYISGSHISVTINGATESMVTEYTSEPNCDATGCANFSLCPGTYNYTAISSTGSWGGTVTVTENGCIKVRLN